MKELFLTSSVNFVAESVAQHIGKPPSELALVFIPTAAEVEEGNLQWLKDDRNALVEAGFKIFDYTITDKTPVELGEKLRDVDVIFISGGNAFWLLEQARKSGFDKLVRELVDQGKIYVGSSAGSVIAGPDINVTRGMDDPEKAPGLKSFEGFGLVDFVVFPHWGNERFRERYTKMIQDAYRSGLKIILLTDKQYVMVQGDTYKVVQVE